MVKLGERLSVFPETFDARGEGGKLKPVTGTVVYIHPKARYCVLEFKIGVADRIREAFHLINGNLAEI